MPTPSSLGWLEGVEAKLSRANEHLEFFHRESRAFARATKRHIVLKVNRAGTEAWLVCWAEDPYPPIRLSVIVGDCLFNLSSALDNLVCGLVRRNAHASKCAGRKFPICTSETAYQSVRASALKGVPPSAQRLVDAFQPFLRPPGTATIDPLNLLHILSNRDKHRAVNLVSGYSRSTRFVIPANDGRIHHVFTPRPLFGESPETIPLTLDPAAIQPSARVESSGTIAIAFRDEGPWGEREVSDVLTTCARYIEDRVIPKFKPFFR